MKKNKSYKGEMLVETVIAMTVFAIIMICSFAVYKTFSTFSTKTSEYVNFESVCLDIDKYYDRYGRGKRVVSGTENGSEVVRYEELWAESYFGDKYSSNGIQKYDVYYQLVNTSATDHAYELRYEYDAEGNLILSIKNVKEEYSAGQDKYEEGYFIIEELNYGKSLAESETGDEAYYKYVQVYNQAVSVEHDNGVENDDEE